MQSSIVSLVAADKPADASFELAGQSFAGKLADLVAEGNRLQQLVAEKTVECCLLFILTLLRSDIYIVYKLYVVQCCCLVGN